MAMCRASLGQTRCQFSEGRKDLVCRTVTSGGPDRAPMPGDEERQTLYPFRTPRSDPAGPALQGTAAQRGNQSRNGFTVAPALTRPSRTAATILSEPGLSP